MYLFPLLPPSHPYTNTHIHTHTTGYLYAANLRSFFDPPLADIDRHTQQHCCKQAKGKIFLGKIIISTCIHRSTKHNQGTTWHLSVCLFMSNFGSRRRNPLPPLVAANPHTRKDDPPPQTYSHTQTHTYSHTHTWAHSHRVKAYFPHP
jgi:hypothetical protein